MTTYTLTGVKGTHRLQDSVIEIVLPDDYDRFSWELVEGEDFSPTEIEFHATGGDARDDATNIRLDDREIGDRADEFAISTLEIVEGSYDGVVLLVVAKSDSSSFWMFQIGGEEANLSTVEVFDFIVDVANVGENAFGLPDGTFGEGKKVELADFTGVDVSEDDHITGTKADETFKGGRGEDQVRGKGGDDRIFGENHDDRLYGENGKDRIYGGNGDDRLKGGSKADKLDGGNGRDRLEGGPGRDTFVFKDKYDNDTILDFANNKDEIWLDTELWTGDLTKRQVVDTFATEADGAVFLDFGDGDELLVVGLGNPGGLVNDIEFI
ncbi:MAG: hypothetical protein AAGH83_05550 [Pseudomonadota bacterium]